MHCLAFILALAALIACEKSKPETVPKNRVENLGDQPAPNGGGASARTTLKFMDDSRANTGLAQFKQDLSTALEKADQPGVLNAFSDIIDFDPGHSKGKAGVIEIWELDGSKEKLAPLKTLLSELLSKGGCLKKEAEVDSTFTAPYSNCISPSLAEKCGESECGVINQKGADLFASPSSNQTPIYHLEPSEVLPSSMDTLCTADFENCTWTRITTFEGLSGFIPKDKMATQSDGLIWLVKESTGWKIRVLRAKGVAQNDT